MTRFINHNLPVYVGNPASARVFEKLGFKLRETVPDAVDIVPEKGGGKVGLHIMTWEAPATLSH